MPLPVTVELIEKAVIVAAIAGISLPLPRGPLINT